MLLNLDRYKNKELNKEEIIESFQGWNAYAKWGDSYGFRKAVVKVINEIS